MSVVAPETAIATWIAKTGGSILGACVALVFAPPKSRWEFLRRFGASVPIGILFSWVPPMFIDFPAGYEGVVASAFLAALCAWWGLETLRLLVKAYRKD